MRKFYKRAALSLLAVFLISVIGFSICVPVGIRVMAGEINSLMDGGAKQALSPDVIEIDSKVDTIVLDSTDYYGNIVFEQSPDNKAYIENYSDTMGSYSSIQALYSENKAELVAKRTYGKLSFNKNVVEKAVIKGLQNYPDAIIYVPKNFKIEIPDLEIYRYTYVEGIEFANKAELKEKYNSYTASAENEYEYEEIVEYKMQAMDEIDEYKCQVIEEIDEYKQQIMEDIDFSQSE